MRSFRILLVDDEPVFCKLLGEFLEGQGYKVTLAFNGDEALKAYAARRPDLVLLDVNMPGKNGLDTFRELKTLDPLVNVIMVTAVLDSGLCAKLTAEGARDYITKPVNFRRLELAVKTRLLLSNIDK